MINSNYSTLVRVIHCALTTCLNHIAPRKKKYRMSSHINLCHMIEYSVYLCVIVTYLGREDRCYAHYLTKLKDSRPYAKEYLDRRF